MDEVEASQYFLFQFLAKGGWVMIPLLACSVLALAIIVERFLFGPSRKRALPSELKQETSRLVELGRYEELVGRCRAADSALSRVILAAVENVHRPRNEIVEALEVCGRQEAHRLQRFLGVLGTIAVISPLLGLLGTVFGMINTFTVIERFGVGDAAQLAGGISEALITTATGLTIAIPVLVFYRFFLQRTKALVLEMESFAIALLDELLRRRGADGKHFENLEMLQQAPQSR